MKKKILIGITSLIILVTLSGCGKEKKKEEEKKPEETPVASFEEQTIDGVKISGLNLAVEEGMTNILAVVENTTEESMYITRIDFQLKDKEGNVLGDLFFWVDKTLEPNTTEVMQTGISSDVTDATTVEYKIVK